MKFEALKCRFLHSEHYLLFVEFVLTVLVFWEKLGIVLRYILTRRFGA
jgi:hypothetical protein